MSKIAIISQPDQGVLIDVGGCNDLEEAKQHLISTLQISSQFWRGLNIDLNLGQLALNAEEVAQIISIASEVGVQPRQVFSTNELTLSGLSQHQIPVGAGLPMKLPAQMASSMDSKKTTPPESAGLGWAETDGSPGGFGEPEPAQAERSQPLPPASQPGSVHVPAVLYLRQTLRSGQAVSHKGHLIIIGDVNPGAEIMAEGDITVWGALRGIAHAGIGGNTEAEIRALRLQPIQLRIAHAIARSPDRPATNFQAHSRPETARIVDGKIRIVANNPE